MKEVGLNDVIHFDSNCSLEKLYHTTLRKEHRKAGSCAYTQTAEFGRRPLNVKMSSSTPTSSGCLFLFPPKTK
jgi:hypothetical protein